MASFSFNTSDAQDEAIQAATAEYNRLNSDPLTPVQFAREHFFHWVAHLVARFTVAREESRRSLYEKASAEDKATIDGILAGYKSEEETGK